MNWNRPLTPKQREKIQKLVSRGMTSFILRVGILGWGLPCFLATTAFDYYTHFRAHQPFDASFSRLSVRLALWLLGGCIFGASMWDRNKHRLSTSIDER
jgi:hypothetical protein